MTKEVKSRLKSLEIFTSSHRSNHHREMRKLRMKDGDYEGEVDNDLRNGVGTLIYKDGSFYTGKWR